MSNSNPTPQNPQKQGVFVYPPGYYPPFNRPEDLSQNLWYAERWRKEQERRAKFVAWDPKHPSSLLWLAAGVAFWCVIAFFVMILLAL